MGYYDLTTPYLSEKYTLDHLEKDFQSRRNISIHHRDSGHQFYTYIPSIEKPTVNVSYFMKGVLSGTVH